MKTKKLAVLEELMDGFLDNVEIADGEDGYISDELHKQMAAAAAAVYDAAMEVQEFMRKEGVNQYSSNGANNRRALCVRVDLPGYLVRGGKFE